MGAAESDEKVGELCDARSEFRSVRSAKHESVGAVRISLQELDLGGGVLIGFMAWLGFLAPVFIGSIFYEKRAPELVAINLGYLLIGLVVMGGILGLWM